jgi:transcriptional regulator with XRE-family HTH domain
MMSLAKRLITLRKEKGLTQQQMADVLGVHVNSLKKYEAGQAQPSLDAISQMPEGEQIVIREVLESLIIKYQSRRWDSGRQAAKR